jgi:hypothetical protein
VTLILTLLFVLLPALAGGRPAILAVFERHAGAPSHSDVIVLARAASWTP